MNNEKLRADIKSALNGMPLAAMGTYAELLNRAYAALGEIDRLRSELGKANSQTAHFEREWYLRGDEIEALTAKLGEQASAPAGYVMVPVEPTHEMLEALWGRSFDQFDEGGAKKIARIKYQGLLAAAPKAEPIKEGYRLVAVNEAFSSLMYCLGQASDTGYLDRLGDLVEPWEAFDYEYVDSLGDKK